jgi:CubicO group peptidase (beta-lactamase class C family)
LGRPPRRPTPIQSSSRPVHPRGGVSGVILVRGKEAAAWGEPDRADQTLSVAKTYLAILAGIAHSRGLLDPDERVSDRVPGIGFDSPHNRTITWVHFLTQTSEWQGECFGMPDQVEHYRRVSYDPKPPSGKKATRAR